MLKFKKEIKIEWRKKVEEGSNRMRELNYSLRGYGEFRSIVASAQDEFNVEVMKAVGNLHRILTERFESTIDRPSMPSLYTTLKPDKFTYVLNCDFGKFEDVGKGILEITEIIAGLEISIEIV